MGNVTASEHIARHIKELPDWRGKMLARVPAVSTPGTAAGPRGGLSDGLAAESEAAGDPAPGSGLADSLKACGGTAARKSGMSERRTSGSTHRT